MSRTIGSPRWLLVASACALTAWGCGSSTGTTNSGDAGGDGSIADSASDVTSDVAGIDAVGDTKADAASDAASDASADTKADTSAPICKSTEAGTCTGATLTYCEEGVGDQTLDCGETEGGTCAKISDDYGYDCVLPTEATCTYTNDDDEIDWRFCAGKTPACVINLKHLDGSCAENTVPCTDDDVGGCIGDRLILDCFGGQPYAIDCKAFNATCNPGGDNATCTGVAKGGVCDGEQVLCGGGTNCDVADDADFGICK